MGVLKFMKEYRRMCNYYPRCFERPRADEPNCNIEEMSDEELAKLISDVEKWSKEHPQRTRLQDLLEKFPKAEINKEGLPSFCCAKLGYVCNCLKSTCKDCWNMPVEEDE